MGGEEFPGGKPEQDDDRGHDCRIVGCHVNTPVYTEAAAKDGGVMDFMPFLEDPTAELMALAEEKRRKGLYPKYIVFHNDKGALGADGPLDDIFVLRPERDPAARKALKAYADWTTNSQLAKDLYGWLGVLARGD